MSSTSASGAGDCTSIRTLVPVKPGATVSITLVARRDRLYVKAARSPMLLSTRPWRIFDKVIGLRASQVIEPIVPGMKRARTVWRRV